MAAISGKPDRIYIVPADGGTPRQISNGEAGNGGDWDPTWSPDDASLAFGAAVGEDPDEVFIQVVDLKTRRFSRLPGSQGMWSPRWSPDGRFIAGENAVLYDLQTDRQTPLFNQGCGYPLWSRTGQFLFCHSNSGWWRIRVRDRKADLVAAPKDFTPANWRWFVVAPDGSLITSRSTGAGDIFALDWELP